MNLPRRKKYLKSRVLWKMSAALAVLVAVLYAFGVSAASVVVCAIAAYFIARGFWEHYVLLFQRHIRPRGYLRYCAEMEHKFSLSLLA
jgi:hypothetical protein